MLFDVNHFLNDQKSPVDNEYPGGRNATSIQKEVFASSQQFDMFCLWLHYNNELIEMRMIVSAFQELWLLYMYQIDYEYEY